LGRGVSTMYVENIILDLESIIYDAKMASVNDDFLKVELKLLKIIEDIKMEALSAKVRSK
jgi:hypothetical protein